MIPVGFVVHRVAGTMQRGKRWMCTTSVRQSRAWNHFKLGPCGAGETHSFPPYASHAVFLSLAPPSLSPASDKAGPSNTRPWVDPTASVDVAAIRHTGNVPDYARRAQCPVQAPLAVVAGERPWEKEAGMDPIPPKGVACAGRWALSVDGEQARGVEIYNIFRKLSKVKILIRRGTPETSGRWRRGQVPAVIDDYRSTQCAPATNTVRQRPPVATGGQRRPPANLLPPGILLGSLKSFCLRRVGYSCPAS
ncbi:hypothetical protein B0H14DRAFT_2575827 [Mycena olivaceomarginata]|nr:hypothetical protein B0H14DRAFT_2575827 [Mycena olivaceomarginata]